MPNKPTTLREEWKDFIGNRRISNNAVADWWLDKFTSHSTELLQKIERLKEKYPVDAVHTTEFETKINWANPAVHQALDEVISIINQEK